MVAIFAVGDVQYPKDAVFDAPMLPQPLAALQDRRKLGLLIPMGASCNFASRLIVVTVETPIGTPPMTVSYHFFYTPSCGSSQSIEKP